jgi:broad specificity phosphatase PhoE
MVDLERNLRSADMLRVPVMSDLNMRAEGAADEIGEPTLGDVLIVASGGILSMTIAGLGVWKLVELVV